MKTRIYFLDNLRSFLILLVVILHAGLVYEPVLKNSWIVIDSVQNNSIGLIRMYLDVFVMFSIFFISGYFIPFSIKNKRSTTFILSKIKRIMVPWLIAVLTLIPAYKFLFLYSRGLPQEEWFSYFHFFARAGSDPGFFANNPVQNWLWFLPVLFAFQMIYIAATKLKIEVNISIKWAAILLVLIGTIYGLLISELGLKGWYHSAIFHFQNERVLIYFLSFLLGALANKKRVFNNESKNIKTYIFANVVLAISMTIFTLVALNLFFNLVEPGRNYFYVSEFADKLAYYFSTVLLMLSFLYILIHSFRFSLNKTNSLFQEFNKNSYSVYILHTIVLGVVAIALFRAPLPAFVKYLILSATTFLFTNMLVTSYRKITQKTVDNRTIATLIFTTLVLGFAFAENSKNQKTQSIETTQEITKQKPMGLHEAIITGNLEAIKQHIKNETNINQKEPAGGSSALITACMFGKTEIARELIIAGANVNQKNNEGSTALHTAAFFGRVEIVLLLLNNGADKTIKNNAGSTARESVLAPFSAVQGIYEYFANTYKTMGLTLDFDQLKTTRVQIAELLK